MRITEWDKSEPAPMDLLLMADPSEPLVHAYLQKGTCMLARHEGIVVGTYVLLPTSKQTIELVNLAVAQNAQGKGLGKYLVCHAIETGRCLGYNRMEVGTGNSSIGPLALYQKCGFRISAVDIDFFTRNYTERIEENGIVCRDMIRMYKEL
ncbi:MAG: GNAT family N-acetyltransferase [Clostridia bacterium]